MYENKDTRLGCLIILAVCAPFWFGVYLLVGMAVS